VVLCLSPPTPLGTSILPFFADPLDHPRYRQAVPDRYAVLAESDRGRSGVVYEATDRVTGDRVAVKITADASVEALAILTTSTHDERIVRIRDFECQHGGLAVVVMDWVTGVSFVDALRPRATAKSRPLIFGQPISEAGDSLYSPLAAASLARVAAVAKSTAEALHLLHQRGLVHGDLQPDNVVVVTSPAGEVHPVLLDLDGAAVGEHYRPMPTTATYMAPEQGRRELFFASDAYGLGVVLFETLTGEVPFAGSAEEVFLKKQTIRAPRPSFLVEGIPAVLDEIVAGLLERAPARRLTLPEVVAVLS
jgi:serine/threonine protein kinase